MCVCQCVRAGGDRKESVGEYCFVTTATHRLVSRGLPFRPAQGPRIKTQTAGKFSSRTTRTFFSPPKLCLTYFLLQLLGRVISFHVCVEGRCEH